MNRSFVLKTLILLIVVIFSPSTLAQSESISVTQKDVNSAIAQFSSSKVQHIEIIEIPPRIMTRSQVTQSMLEHGYHYKLTIRYIKQSLYGKNFQEAIASTVVTPTTDTFDLRWGIIFFDSDDRRLGALYFDDTGSNGAVESNWVTFKGNMFEWLKNNFSSTFR